MHGRRKINTKERQVHGQRRRRERQKERKIRLFKNFASSTHQITHTRTHREREREKSKPLTDA